MIKKLLPVILLASSCVTSFAFAGSPTDNPKIAAALEAQRKAADASRVEKSTKQADTDRRYTMDRITASFSRVTDLTQATDPIGWSAKEIAERRNAYGKIVPPAAGAPDAAEYAELAVKIDAWASSRDAEAQAEATCRATPKCMEPRLAKAVCEAVALKKGYEADLAKERANPAGVVDLNYLHEVGLSIQQADENIKTAKQAYAASQKRPFAGVCPK